MFFLESMNLKNRVADQTNSSVFSLRNPWIVFFLVPIYTFVCGTSTVFIIVTSLIMASFVVLFFTHSKHKVQGLEQEEQSDQEDEYVVQDSNQITDEENNAVLDVGLPDYCSDIEIVDGYSCTTEEDSDVDVWRFSSETCRRPDCSDGSISDEESLIEITLPGGHYVGYKDEEPKFCYGKRSPESVLWWPEMSGEENMIEIDLSVGSIMSSRIEIEA